ncbi:hypothetical protein ABW02_22780 [Niallia circulans]|jgi:hypothetical protein|uniref:PrgI family protein n=1 Tax=Niallia circulans TaxID=1397 RepID=A0A0J1I6U2_NIACI|nr:MULTISPECIES: PrgI family protein [Bacillaceae]EOR22410.1 hypothetical protein A499_18514 [Niallia nealsonii AAU1]MDU1845968.1 PrgI family protein [Niallia nealsonii]SLL35278.1 PrgI family protein [Mycobacteroides abscessus subsp. abscessus]HEO8421598.1 PrgI family protein [Yersinia enterocolitica]KAB7670292.1 PrgI family protein [Bacillus sp. B1-b2]
MSRRAEVPIDMASEQKTILGFISIRQLIYLGAAGSIVYAYIPMVYKIFSSAGVIVALIACVFSVIPTAIFVIVFGFFKKKNLHLNFDQYFLIKMNMKKQNGIWRKGTYPKKWMVNS